MAPQSLRNPPGLSIITAKEILTSTHGQMGFNPHARYVVLAGAQSLNVVTATLNDVEGISLLS